MPTSWDREDLETIEDIETRLFKLVEDVKKIERLDVDAKTFEAAIHDLWHETLGPVQKNIEDELRPASPAPHVGGYIGGVL